MKRLTFRALALRQSDNNNNNNDNNNKNNKNLDVYTILWFKSFKWGVGYDVVFVTLYTVNKVSIVVIFRHVAS